MQIRELRNMGLTKKAVARRLGLDRKTVAKYWDGPAEDPEKTRYRQRSKLTDPYLEYITERLKKLPELTAERIYREIKKLGYTGSKRTVRRCVATLRPEGFREFKPIETLPGEQAQVDWGHCGKIDLGGCKIPLYVFAFSLSWSRVRYVEFITSLGMEFVRARENVVLLGPPGVGKTHLAVSLGIEAINQGYRVQFITAQDLSDLLYSALADGTVTQTMNKLLRNDLIILDELGYVQFDTTGSDHLFQIIAKAYENRSLIVTSNLDFEDWGRLFDQPATAAAFLDRLLHHAHVITLRGDSYRVQYRLTPPLC